MTVTARSLDWVLFDVNETLTDLSPAEQWMSAHGFHDGALSAWLAAVLRDGFAASLAGQPASFAQLGRTALHELARHRGGELGLSEGDESGFWTAVRSAEPHPDVVPGLRHLRDAGVKTATISNGSAAIAQTMLDRAGATDLVDRTLTVDGTSTWKPHPHSYAAALDEIGATADRVALVACHPWDILGAGTAGLTTVWIPRGRPVWTDAYPEPHLTVRGVDEFAARLAGALTEP